MRAATSCDTLDLTSHDYIPRVMPQYRARTSLYGTRAGKINSEF